MRKKEREGENRGYDICICLPSQRESKRGTEREMGENREGKRQFENICNTQESSCSVLNHAQLSSMFQFYTRPSHYQRILHLFFVCKHLFYVIWRTGTKPILTLHGSRHQFSWSGILTYNLPHASPMFYHFETGITLHFFYLFIL